MSKQTSGENVRLRSGRARKLFLLLFSISIAIAVAEIFLRVIGYSYPNFYMPDAERGVALRPNMEGWYRKEGQSYVRINSDGLRDREHAKTKPADTVRIAVIGDSYAEALQVPMENAFWYVMEQRLQGCVSLGGKRVEVINFGVSGYGTAQELITLRRKVWEYSPDIVLLALTTYNDITDNARALKKTDQIPYFVLRDGQLFMDDSFRDTKKFRMRTSIPGRLGDWFLNSSRLIQLIDQSLLALKYYVTSKKPAAAQSLIMQARNEQAAIQASEEIGIDNMIYREPQGEVWNNAWRVTESLIAEMNREVKARNAKFLVVTLSSGIQVAPDAAGRQAFLQKIGATDIFYPDNRIKAFGDDEGFAVLNLAPQLQAYADEHRVYLHGFGKLLGSGHWNQEGHRVAGEIIAQKICEGIAG
ncbi:MAG TPA: SGNH/GDSL hydrolase family protein [Pyrinomonadaceae bacterium]|nr:SGNH/GDSL hydrolase family protein [Pyrinomonadaceae bacterium]